MSKSKKAAEQVEVEEIKVEETEVVETTEETTEEIDSSKLKVASKEDVVEDVPKGNPDPITGESHDCQKDFKFRTINVGGKTMHECTICGNRS